MSKNYAYFVGNLILAVPWLIIFLTRKDLRREMLFGGLLAFPFALTAPFFIPEYWNPPYVFGYIYGLPIGTEDIMFAFFAGGLATIMFEFLEKKRLKKLRKSNYSSHVHLFPYIMMTLILIMLEILFPFKTIYNFLITALIGTIYMAIKRKDLISQILLSGFLFMSLYVLLFWFFDFIFPQYIQEVYNLKNLSGLIFLGLPLEEYLFPFFAGACWSVLYEFVENYKTV